MKSYPDTIIVRHRRENKKKCTLEPLLDRIDCQFFTYPQKLPENIEGYVVLGFDGPLLSKKDFDKGLLVIDGTWKRAAVMQKEVLKEKNVLYRSLPKNLLTAYPRRQLDCPDPEKGLASIEALYVAYLLLGRDPSGLLDDYYWKKEFLNLNKETLLKHPF